MKIYLFCISNWVSFDNYAESCSHHHHKNLHFHYSTKTEREPFLIMWVNRHKLDMFYSNLKKLSLFLKQAWSSRLLSW